MCGLCSVIVDGALTSACLLPAVLVDWSSIATIRIRNQATIGGNLAHADPSQDPPPLLMALDAAIEIAGPAGARRVVPMADFFVDFFETVLEPGEVILGVRVPTAEAGARTVYRKFMPRSADDYATVSVASTLRLDPDGRVAAARIALGGVGPRPVRARAVEEALVGELPGDARLRDAAELVRDAIDPLDDVRGSARYKRDMAAVWVRRAVAEAVA